MKQRRLLISGIGLLLFFSAPLESQQSRARSKSLADSLRKAGNAAMDTRGVPAAMVLWRESLRHAVASGDSFAIVPAWLSIGAGYYRMNRFDSALAYLTRAERSAARIGDRKNRANAIGIIASLYKDRGDVSLADSMYRRASALREKIGDLRGLAADANNLGALAQQRGDLVGAEREYQRALAINRRQERFDLAALNLINLGGVAFNLGQYQRAARLYDESISLLENDGPSVDLGLAIHGTGKVYLARGEYRMSADALERAIKVLQSSGAEAEAIDARVDLASVMSAMGEPQKAATILNETETAARNRSVSPATLAAVAFAQGDIAMEFATFLEADAQYARAGGLYAKAADQSGQARVLEARATLKQVRGDTDSAISLAQRAVLLRAKSGDKRASALTDLLIANVYTARGNASAARSAIRSARSGFVQLGDRVGEAASFAESGDAWITFGRIDSATAAYRAGLSRLGKAQASDVSWRLHAGLANALRRSGKRKEAAAELQRAIEISERAAGRIRVPERRSSFLSEKWAPYSDLAMLEISLGRTSDAFALSERLRARQLLDLMAHGRVTRGALSAREQDLRRTIADLTRRLEIDHSSGSAARETPIDSRSAGFIRQELDRAQREYSATLLDLRESDASYASLVSAKTSTWRDVASQLDPEEALLEYLTTDSSSVVFVVTRDTLRVIDLNVTAGTLSDLIEFARRTIAPPSTRTGRSLWQVPLRRLHSLMIGPVERTGLLRGKRTLLIAPHSEIHFLPFAALVTGDPSHRFLIDRYDVVYTPSATVWTELRKKGQAPRNRGILALAPRTARLAGTRREVDAIQKIYGSSAIVRTDAQATRESLDAMLPRVSTVHFATFGILNKHNPLFSFIELSPGKRDDGHLDVSEVFGMKLSGHLVILSACQTALSSGAVGDVPPGDDWVGLVQAFLQTGARTVVASLWPVEDNATADLMTALHQELARGTAPSAALSRAQRRIKNLSGRSDPFYWAAFTANGRGD